MFLSMFSGYIPKSELGDIFDVLITGDFVYVPLVVFYF